MSNEWIDVPDDAVINEPNRAGRTMVCRGRWALNSLLHAGQHDLIRAIAFSISRLSPNVSSAHSARILRAIFLQGIDILTAVKASHAALWHLVGKPAENIGEYPCATTACMPLRHVPPKSERV